jgi:hypothetical protein
MEKFYQELFDFLTRCRNAKRTSKAGSMAVTGINKAKLIHDFLNNRIRMPQTERLHNHCWHFEMDETTRCCACKLVQPPTATSEVKPEKESKEEITVHYLE